MFGRRHYSNPGDPQQRAVVEVRLNDLVRCPACGAALDDGLHADSRRRDCSWGGA